MRVIFATLLTVLFLLPISAIGEIQTITHTVKQPFGGSQSPDDARISGVAKAKREALEKAGTYIGSLTVVKSLQVDKDEILALADAVLKVEIVSQENFHTKDAFGIVVVKVVVDTSVLEERVKKLLQDRTHLGRLTETQESEKKLLQKIAQLEGENRKLMAKNQRTPELEKQFQQTSRGLTAVDWVKKAFALWDGGKFTDQAKPIEYLNNAVKLKPDYAEAYNNRGDVYVYLGQHQRAIEDFDEAIRLKKDYAVAYYNRGTVYGRELGQPQRAIDDLSEAIRLMPNFAPAYSNRGLAYIMSGNNQEGCRSLVRACERGLCKTYEYYKQKGYCR